MAELTATQIIVGIIIGIIAILGFIYVSFTARQKGPILTNDYLFASDQEKRALKNRDKKADYKIDSTLRELSIVMNQ